MTDWKQGGMFGSIERWAKREVGRQLGANPVARRARYGIARRLLRVLFAQASFWRFITCYLVVDLVLLCAEGAQGSLAPNMIPAWISAHDVSVRAALETVPSDLFGTQATVLGVISLALALITLLVQRDDAATDIHVYYHESLFFGITASCLALITVLAVQFAWPLQSVLHMLGFGSVSPIYKAVLLASQIIWFTLNMVGVAHFTMITFSFVQRSARERLREQYTANHLMPAEMAGRIRSHLFQLSGWQTGSQPGLGGGGGYFALQPSDQHDVEISRKVSAPSELFDVRMELANWVLDHWIKRFRDEAGPRPSLWVMLALGHTLNGEIRWFRRRGGPPLSWPERFVLKRAFRFRELGNKSEAPDETQIVEELATRVLLQIERNLPVAFDAALDELVRYHGFLLALGAARTPEGAPFSYVEITGAAWHAPHIDWLRQYRRLFDRAADRIPSDAHYVAMLANVPSRLMHLPDGLQVTDTILERMLDLMPGLVHAIEAWMTRRSVFEAIATDGEPGTLRLSGSDAKAHGEALREIVGTWESLPTYAPAVRDEQERRGRSDEEMWPVYWRAWRMFWPHLINTAYCLAACAWNDDEEGALIFQETLVRWPGNSTILMPSPVYLRWRELLFPDLLRQDWDEAKRRIEQISYHHGDPVTPGSAFTAILKRAHIDILHVTAATLLYWVIAGKSSGVAVRTAAAILDRVGAPEHNEMGARNFAQTMMDLVRLRLAKVHPSEEAYGKGLDDAARSIDGMTEKGVVPGRVFTPSTIHEREQLVLADIAILAKVLARTGASDVLERMKALANAEDVLPRGDGSLRDVLAELDRYRKALDTEPEMLESVISQLGVEDAKEAIGALTQTMETCKAVIDDVRNDRLRSRPVSSTRLDERRVAIEQILLAPDGFRHFPGIDAKVGASANISEHDETDQILTFGGVAKGSLVEPRMVHEIANEVEGLTSAVDNLARALPFRHVFLSEKAIVTTIHEPTTREFWNELVPIARKVGQAPMLLMPEADRAAVWSIFNLGDGRALADLQIQTNRGANRRNHDHLGEIGGIQVSLVPLPFKRALLLSRQHLRSVRYEEVSAGHLVSIIFQPDEDDDLIGNLVVRFRQRQDWDDSPIFEIRLPGWERLDPAGDTGEARPSSKRSLVRRAAGRIRKLMGDKAG